MRWIEEYFGVEESDRKQLDDPHGTILAPGGTIAIAELDGDVVGCGALVPPHHLPEDGLAWLELVKMATAPEAQGAGVGGKVLDFLIEEARKQGCDAIWLETNETLTAATRLYERKGFRRLSCEELWPTPYARCNLQMVLTL
nr:GNAT family N-acetyltransferase [Qipengyuania xiamenensis]